MTLADPTTPSSERKWKPVFTDIPQNNLPGSSSSANFKLKEDNEIQLSNLLQENAATIDSRLCKVQTGSLLYFHLQRHEESQSVDVTACGNTKFPFKLYECCNEFIPISIEKAINLENITVRQFDYTEWFNQRKNRIAASQFARVAKRKKQVNIKFIQSLFDPKNSAATSYGTANETMTKEQYAEKYMDNHLHDCGLVVNSGFSFLGATPDGKLFSIVPQEL
ncbi:unnamed protein product [Mytilus edulis]|uniref:YqaJ viral recombinase domain-containing protein n=1 Tax=Mytilus edulis TaxID=6550 RepID=A0A8S3VC19_MYTED|nr:unnamed protein product [Mytilus edulis]